MIISIWSNSPLEHFHYITSHNDYHKAEICQHYSFGIINVLQSIKITYKCTFKPDLCKINLGMQALSVIDGKREGKSEKQYGNTRKNAPVVDESGCRM